MSDSVNTPQVLPKKKYQIIYADPPWNERGGGKIKRGADRHYPLMRTEDIFHLPVKNIADNKKRELSENRKEQNIHNLTDNSKTELTIEFSVNKRKNYKVPSRTAKLRKKKAHKDE